MSTRPTPDNPPPGPAGPPAAVPATETVVPSNIFDGSVPDDSNPSSSRLAMLTRAGGAPTQAESLVGMTCGDFTLQAELGRGGMGVVYRANQARLDRPVALKMLLSEAFQDPARVSRFQAEARAAANLGHPNIVEVYHIGECAAGHYFAMELIEGQTLQDLVRKGKIAIPWCVSSLLVIAEAVHFAHSKGVVHRDLKPANIMLDVNGRLVLLDFGIAKLIGKSSGLTQQGTIMGTPAYMAPEQAGEDPPETVGPHSDVYSLGAILYTLLTGRPPYDAPTPLRIILKVVSDELPTPVRALRPQVPEELERICMKCLAKKPADRYPTAEDLAEDLRRLQTTGAAAPKGSLRVVLVTSTSGKELPLTRARTLFGRSSDCDVVLKSPDVSKHHCQILIDGDQAVVEDLDSINGLTVNSQRVRRAVLQDGDRMRIVRYVFQVRLIRK